MEGLNGYVGVIAERITYLDLLIWNKEEQNLVVVWNPLDVDQELFQLIPDLEISLLLNLWESEYWDMVETKPLYVITFCVDVIVVKEEEGQDE